MRHNPISVAIFAAMIAFAVTAPVFSHIAYAMAQPAVETPGVDFTPIISNLWVFFVAVLTAVGSLLIRAAIGFLKSKTRLEDNQFEALLASRADDILHKAIGNANVWMKEQIADPDSPIKDVKINSMWMRMAANYANRSMPDIISYFGWTAEDVTDKIKTRLDQYVSIPDVDSAVVKVSS